ncbi:NAD(P)H-hydrate dehydratase [Ferrovum sp. PN-J185]|uniref:NAD(P)H-hydrate dehydratase n=1 Tax=Ferrovum sp. PN-J185 TaxID=1356306 RepID=UPI001E34EF33|nr:NAD(P)H-hydrate dehydratase [Ferrovum sp. PN-J185]MCC6069297.1 NAD(P)H-hydrate dehydratase [Ferrovum sp. PN-J185]
MTPILRKNTIRQIEQNFLLTNPAIDLTQIAGHHLAQYIATKFKKYSTILLLLGPGAKGLDGINAVEKLSAISMKIWILTTQQISNSRCLSERVKNFENIKIVYEWPNIQFDLIIDGLFGIGLNKELQYPYTGWIKHANSEVSHKIAIDIPTGLDTDTGMADVYTFNSDTTYTLISGKIGLFTNDGPDFVGQIILDKLNFDYSAAGYAYNQPIHSTYFHTFKKNTHKTIYGDVGIIGGANNMLGALLLAGDAALHSGAGRVWLSPIEQNHLQTIPIFNPQLMSKNSNELIASHLDCLIVGPGSNTDNYHDSLLEAITQAPYPIILDAGVLDNLTAPKIRDKIKSRSSPTILTPHPGEASRLLGYPITDRFSAAQDLSQRYNSWVILKGQGTIIYAPDGRWWINQTGNSALSIPGSGDILCGVIASLITRFNSVELALLNAINIHGQAGDSFQKMYLGTIGMTHSELIKFIRLQLNKLQSSNFE